MKKRIVRVVRAQDETFVQKWQYSQGHFDVVTNSNVLTADDFSGDNGLRLFNTFFRNKGYALVEVEVSWTEKDI